MTCTLRNYYPADLAALVTLINSADAVDKTGEATSLQEKQGFFDIPTLVPNDNVFVAEEDGRIIGYAYLIRVGDESETSFRCGYQVHPIRRGRGLEERLLQRLAQRAQERLGECATPVVDLQVTACLTETDRLATLRRFGLVETRRFWRMVRPLAGDIPEPNLPAGIVTSAYRSLEDDVRMHAVDAEVFRDHWGHAEHSLEYWQHYMSLPMIRPELCLIATEAMTHAIAGYCIIAVNEDENLHFGIRRGWIDILGVRRPLRGRGLGTALLLAGLHNLRRAGLSQAALGCDAENLTGATRIYKGVGFGVDSVRLCLRMRLREPQSQSRLSVEGQVGLSA